MPHFLTIMVSALSNHSARSEESGDLDMSRYM
uniref:Uncharacterized protein n=1 Tax=Zea mays TaxID=4577 RepID=C4J7I1_MAIZE|nr:unknown [Zea mays]